jgi:hypothetical protein
VSRAEAKAKKARYSLDAALAEKKRLDAAERKKQELEACWTLSFFSFSISFYDGRRCLNMLSPQSHVPLFCAKPNSSFGSANLSRFVND